MESLEGGEERLFQSRALRSERLQDLSVKVEHYRIISLNPTMPGTWLPRSAKIGGIGHGPRGSEQVEMMPDIILVCEDVPKLCFSMAEKVS